MASATAESPRTLPDPTATLLDALVAGQVRATQCVAREGAALAAAALLFSAALRAGGRVLYIGAGSSGLLAMQDGLELPGTFGLDPGRVRFVTPGGESFRLDGPGEDDEGAAHAAVDRLEPGAADVAVAVSASGATPFTLAAARCAKAAEARLVAVVCRRNSPLAALADAAVTLDVGLEAVEGSTRLAAGTAQKAALGVLSTLAAADLGWVYDGMMVALRPDNAKLRARARTVVARAAGVAEAEAEAALRAAGDDAPVAIAAAAGRLDAEAARALVAECGGDIHRILARLKGARGPVNRSAGIMPAGSGG